VCADLLLVVFNVCRWLLLGAACLRVFLMCCLFTVCVECCANVDVMLCCCVDVLLCVVCCGLVLRAVFAAFVPLRVVARYVS